MGKLFLDNDDEKFVVLEIVEKTVLEATLKALKKEEKRTLKENKDPLLREAIIIVGEMADAIQEFGEYSFADKGPREVMDLDAICKRLKKYGPKDAGEILKKIRNFSQDEIEKHRCECLWSALMINLQDWDEFMDDIVENDEGLHGY